MVLETRGDATYVGRFDSEDEAGVHLQDVGVHREGEAVLSKEEYLRRSLKFGVRSEQKHVVVPSREVVRILRLGEVEG